MDPKQKNANALRWKKTGLLNGIDDNYVAVEIAALLENLRKNNEDLNLDGFAQFKRLSIPLTRRAYAPNSFIGWHIVSVQAATSPTPMVYNMDEYGNLKETEIACKARNMRTYIPLVKANGEVDESKYAKVGEGLYLEGPLAKDYLPSQNNMDLEAEITIWTAGELCNELNAEIIGDLTTHAKTRTDFFWKSRDHFHEALAMLSAVCERECFKPVNWFVLSENLAKELFGLDAFLAVERDLTSCSNIQKIGILNNRWSIYSNSWTENQVLCGYRGRHYDAGYQYCPFVPLVETDYVIDESENVSRKRLYMRYGKRLWNNGYYAAMKVSEFRPTKEKDDE